MKAVKIDVTKRAIYSVDVDDNDQLHSMYKVLECDTIEFVAFIKPPSANGKTNHLYVDENALIIPNVEGFFAFCPNHPNVGYLFKGHGCIIGFDGKEDWCDHSVDRNRLHYVIRFLSQEDLQTFKILN